MGRGLGEGHDLRYKVPMAARHLAVIDEALGLAIAVYQLRDVLPESEKFGLLSQTQRAAVSVGSNLSEGAERRSDADFARFVGIALGSLAELKFQLRVAQSAYPGSETVVAGLLDRSITLARRLVSLQRSLRKPPRSSG